jgi:hypothetical protein
MDNDTKQKLIVIVAVLAAALAFYYIASPYRNCLRSWEKLGGIVDYTTETECAAKSSW